ncbi:hypothetical protein PWG71_28385 [Nocardiopsis sp. N85]|uniref:hypothetical protein n=1 Tax=Nocardiopsis sp. N85 TaxID=3029400 RepID=UPI00237F7B65|nr:hypothetical protein [Nocardiopsis sp. N85]MDE3725315.1 hypothetical protein [Nocardiopsis sp. N85]
MPAPRKYPDELRERATRMVADALRDPATRPGAIARIDDWLITLTTRPQPLAS